MRHFASNWKKYAGLAAAAAAAYYGYDPAMVEAALAAVRSLL